MPLKMARWLSWLERRPVTAEVDGSNPFRVVLQMKIIISNGKIAEEAIFVAYFIGWIEKLTSSLQK